MSDWAQNAPLAVLTELLRLSKGCLVSIQIPVPRPAHTGMFSCFSALHELQCCSISLQLIIQSQEAVALMQIVGSAQQKGVQALATLDERLEKTPLLEELDTHEMPDEVTDSNGQLTQDCSEVKGSAS